MSTGLKINSRQRARWLATLVAGGALAIYQATLHPGFFPGESSRQVAVALRQAGNIEQVTRTRLERARDSLRQSRASGLPPGGVTVREAVRETTWTYRARHRLWGGVCALTARLPLGDLPWRMNALSALFGALSVGLLFALVRALVLLFTFHVSPVPARRRKAVATVAGLAAAAALGSAVPFWLASTRCLPLTFDCLLQVIMGWLLLQAIVRHREWPLLIFGTLLAAFLFENSTGLLILPLMLFFASRAIRMGDIGYAGGHVSLMAGMLLGGSAYLMLAWLSQGSGMAAPFFAPFRDIILSLQYFGAMVFGGWMADSLWLIVLCFVVMPALAMIGMVIWGDPERIGSSGGLLLLALMGTSTIALTSSSLSPWGIIRHLEHQPLGGSVFLLSAMMVGFLVAQGYLMAGGRYFPDVTRGRRPGRGGGENRGHAAHAPLGRLLISYTCILLLAVGIFNFREVIDWREPLSSQTAAEVVRRLDGRRWIVSDGSLDVLIRLHAHMARRFVGFLPDDEIGSDDERRIRTHILRDAAFVGVDEHRVTTTMQTQSVSFVQALLALTPAVERQVWVMRQPDRWQSLGYTALPDVVGFQGARTGDPVDWDALRTSHEAFWDRLDSLPPLGPNAPAWMRGRRAHVRQLIADVATQLADALARAGRLGEAQAVLSRAGRIKEEPMRIEADLFY